MEGQQDYPDSINLRPYRPEKQDGKRDFLTINTWIFKIYQYLSLMRITNPGIAITEESKIMFAASFLPGTAAIWWFKLDQNNTIPTSWQLFKQSLRNDFLPEDHVRRARDRLRRSKQKS